MDLERLNRLLEKYWEGQLTEEEEGRFRAELLTNKAELKGELKELADWFSSAASLKQSLKLDPDFEAKILSEIKPESEKAKDSWSWWKIAAAVLIITTLGYTAIVLPQNKKQEALAMENTQTDPEKALTETKATLALMASMMNSGKEQLQSLEYFKIAQEKIMSNKEMQQKTEESKEKKTQKNS